jgi:hypothetical protein
VNLYKQNLKIGITQIDKVSPNCIAITICQLKSNVQTYLRCIYHQLHVHLKYFCGEGAQRTEAQSRTRRNNDRDSNSQRNNNGSSGKNNNKKGLKKKISTKTSKKRGFKVNGDEDYDSESDLSIQSDPDFIKITKTRTPRVAASKAKSRVTAAVKKERKVAMEGGSSEEEYIDSDEDDADSSEEDIAVIRAKERQAKAFAKASKRNRKGEMPVKKSFSDSKKDKKSVKNGKKKIKGKRGKQDSSSDEDDSIQKGDFDLPDIDMSELIAEAMAGCQLSVLHSLCWWRIVLGEQFGNHCNLFVHYNYMIKLNSLSS